MMVTWHGYKLETHEVTTKDGYILTMHRIPRKKNIFDTKGRPAVYLQHGIHGSSADWLVSGPNRALGRSTSDINNYGEQLLLKLFQLMFLRTMGMTYGWEISGEISTADRTCQWIQTQCGIMTTGTSRK